MSAGFLPNLSFYFLKTEIGSLMRMPAFPFASKDYFKL